MNLQIEYVGIDSIEPYENNARHHGTEDIKAIVKSIEEFGFNDPIGVWNNQIVEGHGRLMAAKELGMTEVPIIRLDELTDEQRKAYALAHNKTAELSDWDFNVLASELQEITDIDMTEFGFKTPELEDEDKEVIQDTIPDAPIEATARLGDIFELGGHRLICGDSTDSAVIDKLMNGEKADMVFTDPPYGVAYTGGMKIEDGKIQSNNKKQIKNDALDYENLYSFLLDAFVNLREHTKERAALYIFYAHSRSREFLNAFHDAELKQRSVLIWHKTSGGFGDFMAQYMNAYEPCIYGSNGEAVNWYGPTNEKTVWDMDKEKKCDLHPTMKPIELVSRAIRNSSKQGQSVLDLFGGSGSTLIACEQLNRKCFMCELDPKYVDVIIKRWEQLTGKKAILVNNGKKEMDIKN
jgi:site-specific DNA-methyltransferase (adenine-specific)